MSDISPNEKPADDAILLAHIQQGSKQHFRMMVDRHLDRVWRVAFRVLEDASEAEDVTQEVFVTLWQKSDTLSADRGNIASWLHKVSLNRALDIKRSQMRHPKDELQQDQFASDLPGQDTMVAASEDRKIVYHQMQKLPEAQMSALMLYYFDEMPVEQISSHLGTSEVAVRSLIKRGKAGLRDVLARDLLQRG